MVDRAWTSEIAPTTPAASLAGSIALATPSVAFQQRVQQAFGGSLNGSLRHWRVDDDGVGIARMVAEQPHAIVLGPDVDDESALEAAGRVDRDHPGVSVVLVADPSPDLWQRAMRVGVREIIAPDASDSDIRETLTRAVDVADRRRRSLGASSDDGAARQILAVVAPKGGAGKTLVATNLALGLARRYPGDVVLVDFDLRFGDVGSALQLVPEHTVADAAASAGYGDAMAMKVFLTEYERLFVLCAPESPAQSDQITPQQVTDILQLLSEEFRYVVVDTAAGLESHALAAVETATDLLLVCSLDVSAIRSLAKEVAVLDELGVRATRRMVVNRVGSRVGVELTDVEETVGLPAALSIPSSRGVPFSMNQGVPIIDSEPRSAVARALGELVSVFADTSDDQRGSWMRRLRS